MKKIQLIFFLLFIVLIMNGQTTNDILNLLVQNQTIKQEDADSVRADAAIKQQEADSKKKSFSISAGKAIKLGGYTQVRYQNFQQAGKVSGFDIRRARLDAKGDITPYFGYGVQYDLAVSPKLLDAYADFKLYDFLNFKVGQFVIPFSLENTTSDTKLYTIDRTAIVENLSSRKGDVIGDNNGRDIGLQAGGSLLKFGDAQLIDYAVGIFNGNGINKSDNYKFKDVSGRLVFHVLKGLDLGFSGYKGQYIHDSKTSTKLDTTQKIVIKDGIKTTTIKQDSSTTTITEYGPQDRIRYGADINFELGGASLRAEYLKGENGIGNSTKAKLDGYYLQAGYYLLKDKLQLIAKYEKSKNNSPIAKEITDISRETFGLNYYINNITRFQVAYYIVKDKINKGDFNQVVAQFQIGF